MLLGQLNNKVPTNECYSLSPVQISFEEVSIVSIITIL